MGGEKDHQHRWDDSGICIVCETSYVTIVAELAARLHEAEAALMTCVEALRLTREYVGEDLLPALPGWSWHDATLRAEEVLSKAVHP